MKLSEALKIVQTSPSPGSERLTVYLACGFTPLHLATFLAAHVRRNSPKDFVEILTGDYGDLAGNLTRLQKSGCDTAVVMIEWFDFDARLGLRSLGGWHPEVLAAIQRTGGADCPRLAHPPAASNLLLTGFAVRQARTFAAQIASGFRFDRRRIY